MPKFFEDGRIKWDWREKDKMASAQVIEMCMV